MKIKDFIARIEEHPDLEITMTCPNGEGFGIRHIGADAEYTVLYVAVEEHRWTTLVGVLTGEREPRPLRHMSRIVGYYSQIENWNKSKLGELRARRKGDYEVSP